MKKRLLYLCLLLPLLGSLASCNDDNEIKGDYAETSGDNWESVAGTYRGKMYVSFDGVGVDTIYQQAEIASDNRNKMTLRINSIIVDDNIKFNNIFFKDIYFTKNGNTISFQGESLQNMGLISNVSLKLQGTLVGGDIDLTVNATSVMIRPVKMQLMGSKLDKPLSTDTEIIKVTMKHPYIITEPDFGYVSSSTGGSEPAILVYITDTLHLTDSTEIWVRPEFQLPKGATITYPDSLMNIATNKVTYTVWAEDSIHRATYHVRLVLAAVKSFPCNTWKNALGWEEPERGWATNNAAMKKLMDGGKYTGNYPVTRVKGMNTGEWAAQMETVLVGTGADQEIFAGSFFQGDFNLNMEAPLFGPEYGVAFTGQPAYMRGYYKYMPSSDVFVGNSLLQDTMRFNDTCRIRAILYEIVNPDDKLDSLNYMNDPKLVAVAEMGRYQSGTYQPEYKRFSIPFVYQKSFFISKRYKIALICSSSKDADKKKGAPGSRLTVGGIDVMYSNK